MHTTAFDLAQRFVGVREVPGAASNPLLLAMLRLDAPWCDDDVVPWCSAFVNGVAWLLRLPRSKSLSARSWLAVGRAVELSRAAPGWDVVVLTRGQGAQPGPDVLRAPGHVGFFAGVQDGRVLVLGGNQSDAVSIAAFDASRVLGVRRLV